jgi:hypothetical protein
MQSLRKPAMVPDGGELRGGRRSGYDGTGREEDVVRSEAAARAARATHRDARRVLAVQLRRGRQRCVEAPAPHAMHSMTSHSL